jgi:hypothetical protein
MNDDTRGAKITAATLVVIAILGLSYSCTNQEPEPAEPKCTAQHCGDWYQDRQDQRWDDRTDRDR